MNIPGSFAMLLQRIADVQAHVDKMTQSLHAIIAFSDTISLEDHPQLTICPSCKSLSLNAKSKCIKCEYDDIKFMADEIANARRKLFQMRNSIDIFLQKHASLPPKDNTHTEPQELPKIVNIADYRKK